MTLIKVTALSTAAGGLLLGGLAIFYLPKIHRQDTWTPAKGHSLACQDYADGKQRLFLVRDPHKVQLPGIIYHTMSYIRHICHDSSFAHADHQSGRYQFVKAYNQTMARLLALENQSASAV
jgi:hypothetical protein